MLWNQQQLKSRLQEAKEQLQRVEDVETDQGRQLVNLIAWLRREREKMENERVVFSKRSC